MANALTGSFPLPAILMEESGAAAHGSMELGFPLPEMATGINERATGGSLGFPLADVSMQSGARFRVLSLPLPDLAITSHTNIPASIAAGFLLPDLAVVGKTQSLGSMALGFPLPVLSADDAGGVRGTIAAVFIIPSADIKVSNVKGYNPKYERDSTCI